MNGKVETVMHEYAHGNLHSGSKAGPKVKDRKQAVAIALSEARAHMGREKAAAMKKMPMKKGMPMKGGM